MPVPDRCRKVLLVSLVLVVGGGALVGWLVRRRGTVPAALPDPRLTVSSPYRNVRPEVAYVADDRCAECHADIAAKYRQHPMGRSLAPAADAPELEDYRDAAETTFAAAGFEYRVTKRQAVVMHEEIKRGPDGQAAGGAASRSTMRSAPAPRGGRTCSSATAMCSSHR